MHGGGDARPAGTCERGREGYTESEASVARRLKFAADMKTGSALAPRPHGRPDKHQRALSAASRVAFESRNVATMHVTEPLGRRLTPAA